MSLHSAEPVTLICGALMRPLVVIQQTAEPGTPTDPALNSIKSVTLYQRLSSP